VVTHKAYQHFGLPIPNALPGSDDIFSL
jgi:Holliday junction DNA helicase RuvB